MVQIHNRALRIKHVREITSLSNATIWRRVKDDPKFPKAYKQGHCTCWDSEELIAYLDACKASRRGAA